MEYKHITVLKNEAVDALNLKSGAVAVDGTLGGGGHASAILEKIGPQGLLIGIDKDINALQAAEARLSAIGSNFKLVHGGFEEVEDILLRLGVAAADAFLLDLGVSSPQLSDADRGFSYKYDAPLDMRMDQSRALTAWDIVNGDSEEEITRILYEYGEERWSKRIAQFIVKRRPIDTTGALVEAIKAAVPAAARQGDIHPARRSFQALRIAVNGELRAAETAVDAGSRILKPGGRFAVITFHSLEDRIIKQGFHRLEHPCTCPKDYPVCICGKKPTVKVITRKPILPSEEEQTENPRARSAKLRVCEKL